MDNCSEAGPPVKEEVQAEINDQVNDLPVTKRALEFYKSIQKDVEDYLVGVKELRNEYGINVELADLPSEATDADTDDKKVSRDELLSGLTKNCMKLAEEAAMLLPDDEEKFNVGLRKLELMCQKLKREIVKEELRCSR